MEERRHPHPPDLGGGPTRRQPPTRHRISGRAPLPGSGAASHFGHVDDGGPRSLFGAGARSLQIGRLSSGRRGFADLVTGGLKRGRSLARSQIPRNRHIRRHEDEARRSDTQLLMEARTCAEPFGVFYERRFASVLAFFRRRVTVPEEASTLRPRVRRRLASVPRFRPGPEPPQAWLFAIARHKLNEACVGVAFRTRRGGGLRCSRSSWTRRRSRSSRRPH